MDRIRLNTGWDIIKAEGIELSERVIKSSEAISYCSDHKIAFVILGQNGSFFLTLLERIKKAGDVWRLLDEGIKKLFSGMPDFNTLMLNDDKGCAIVMPGDCCHVIPWNEMELDKRRNSITIPQALVARSILMDDCENRNVIGFLVPPGLELPDNIEENWPSPREVRGSKARKAFFDNGEVLLNPDELRKK